ncbi:MULTISPECIES: DHA2 family efflux MFS transporter permease subunit [Micrococcaceae]|uniref:DHA2 family efflux MFS transporter permease subunit n=1 Tax=Micrococcaceae TaxID=1268 RepID=UPI00103553F5|nr:MULTISPECIES: DHA2 family efflux MFS transporter permease subunit [Micrococcaceae]TAP25933.1 DHA2 family efflux MFS transporter permease subunit [Arthrobacter sp. S41]UXN31855.1 DHA2 family efflux MFS transporter permease subunit [Glutamicibacter sp. M10]
MTSEPTKTEPQASPPQSARAALSTKALTGIIAALALAAFMMILNETVLTVALPGIMADMNITAATGQWLTTGFLLTMSVVIPTTGFLLQRFNHRSLFMFAIISFLVGTVIAVIAPSFAFLLLARIIQALGTAIILPLLMTTTLTLVPVHLRGTIMGLNSIVIGVGPAIGPTVSGAVVHALGWHYIFAMMLPIAAVVLILGIIFFKVPSTARSIRVDGLSVVLSALAFGFLVYGISSIEHASTNPALTILSFVVGLVSLAIFIKRQLKLTGRGRELLNLSAFSSRGFTFAIIMIMIAFGTLLGSLMIVPLMLESGKGIDSLKIGMMLLPGGVAQAIASPIFGRIYDKHGPRPVLIPGAIMLAAGQWLYTLINAETQLWMFMITHIVFSIGLALLMTGLMSSAMATLDPRLFGHGSAIFNTGQQLGGAIGTTIFVTVMSVISKAKINAGTDAAQALFSGAHIAFIIGAVLATIGIVFAVCIKGSAPAQRR